MDELSAYTCLVSRHSLEKSEQTTNLIHNIHTLFIIKLSPCFRVVNLATKKDFIKCTQVYICNIQAFYTQHILLYLVIHQRAETIDK